MADGGTQLQGNFRDCGPGHPPQLDYSCQGTSCNALDPFPFGNTVANTAGISLDYKSSSRCESFDSPYYGPMLFKQQGSGPGTDGRVFQDQNITLPNCKGLHIFSDGTTQGTKVNGYTRANQPDCAPQPPPQSFSVTSQNPAPSNPVGQYIWTSIGGSPSSVTAISAPGSSVAPSVTSATSSPSASSTVSVAASSTSPTTAASGTPSSTQSSPALYTGGTTHVRPKTGILLLLMLALSVFMQGSNAYIVPIEGNGLARRVAPLGPDTERIAMYKLQLRAASDDIRTYAGTFGTYVAGKVGAGGQEYAKGLISGAISNICQGYFSGTPQQAFTPTVVNNCVSSVYSNDTGLSAAARFVSVFGASMFCNYVVSQAYPVAEQFSGEACHGLQDLIIPSPVTTTIQLPSTTQPVPTTEPPPTTQSLRIVVSLDPTSAVTPPPTTFSSSTFTPSLPSAPITKPTNTRSITTATASSNTQSTVPIALVEKSGWKFTFAQSDEVSAWENNASYFVTLTPGGQTSVNTRCLTVEEVTGKYGFPEIQVGTPMIWETRLDPPTEGMMRDTCCIRLSSGSACETGGAQVLEDCIGFNRNALTAAKSFIIYGCTGLYVPDTN